MFNIKTSVFFLIASVLFLGACSLSFKIPKDMPPQVIVPPRVEAPVEILPTTLELEQGRNVMTEVLIPDAERRTEALLQQYQEGLEGLEKNLQ